MGTDPQAIRLEDLPPLLADLVDLIGLGAALTLAERWGGVRHYYPRPESLTDDHPLARMLGSEAARRLCGYVGGGELIVPKASRALRAVRDRDIRASRANASVRELAERHRLSERRVWEIVSGQDEDSAEARGQMRLF